MALLWLAPSSAFAQTHAYEPSAARIEAGGIAFVGGDLAGVGGTVSFHYAFGAQRLVFVGARLAILGGGEQALGVGGFGGIADADFGLRPRLATWRSGAFALAISGGVGGAFISDGRTTLGLFHLAARLGPSFDLGAFALDALVGPSMLASGTGAAAALECTLDLGARF